MSYYSTDGMFGAGIQNPQFSPPPFMLENPGFQDMLAAQFPGLYGFMGGPLDQTGHMYGNKNLTRGSGPFGGIFRGNEGWVQNPGYFDPIRESRALNRKQNQYNRQAWTAAQGRKLSLNEISDLWDRLSGMGKASGGELPGKYTPGASAAGVNPVSASEVVKAAEPGIKEKMERYFAGAAQKLGASGASLGSGYAKELAKGARKAAADIADVTTKTAFTAGEGDANRATEMARQANDLGFKGWQTHGNWMMKDKDREWQWQSQMSPFLQDLMRSYMEDMYGAGPPPDRPWVHPLLQVPDL